ncbi:succinate dehydrogenase, cytochrome b556 subunit [Parendozoicomonas haliclonae]|uniref:Succinate dehydrogenase cytochrome b556 subunit n=1 Tax=Parendozoicomonas haliclonae TaxID=1960125 RepID=A0A1X7AMS5_9GAMM|nr:succinate dehydrogenase, cytochrome b556 subunit [Parendozoicomonas haliclonae]SMA49320.1 Succinate dehydrogenase cytochrome b556 subunit [Parendozoicomonas haliclonae]
MNSKRPVNLDLTTIRLPLPAYTSILHRISGVILFVGIAFLLYGFELSLSNEQGYQQFVAMLQSPIAKFITWGLLTGLGYHLVAGIKHLLMDAGFAESKESGKIAAQVTLVLGVVLSVLAGVWVW